MATLNDPITSQETQKWITEHPDEIEDFRRRGSSGRYRPRTPEINEFAAQQIRQQRLRQFPTDLASMADPYARERDQLIRDPSAAISESPFFKFMQERALNAVQGRNRAGGFAGSGRGLMALQEAGQKSAADFYFPYLSGLGRPGEGADAFWQAYQYLNPQFNVGGTSRLQQPRQSLASMAAGNGGATAPPAFGLPSGGGMPFTGMWENPYGPGMGPLGSLPGYGPTSGAGTGYWMNNQTGAGGQFTPGFDPSGRVLPLSEFIDMGV